MGKEVASWNPALFEGSEHLVLGAAGEAVEQDVAVLGFSQAQVRSVPVVVGGTEGEVLVLALGPGGDFELLEHALHRSHAAPLPSIRAALPANTISTVWSGSSSSTAASSPQAVRSERRRCRAPSARRSKITSS